MWTFWPDFWVEFGRWILGGEFLEGEFFRGALLQEKTVSKNSTQEFGSKIRVSKICYGFRRAQNPLCRKFVPDKAGIHPWTSESSTFFTALCQISPMDGWYAGEPPRTWRPIVDLKLRLGRSKCSFSRNLLERNRKGISLYSAVTWRELPGTHPLTTESWKLSTATARRVRKETFQRETLAPPVPMVDVKLLQKKTSKDPSTITTFWPVEAIFKQRSSTMEVGALIPPSN